MFTPSLPSALAIYAFTPSGSSTSTPDESVQYLLTGFTAVITLSVS